MSKLVSSLVSLTAPSSVLSPSSKWPPGRSQEFFSSARFKINILFPQNYPFKSPSVGFEDKIYHPNVDFKSGTICLNVLNSTWTPIYTVQHIVETFLPQLLTYPNADDPLNIEAAKLFTDNPEGFKNKVREYINLKK